MARQTADAEADSATCCACGACCFNEDSRYVLVSGEDYDRLGARAEELTHFASGLCFMRMHEGHCVALELQTDGRVRCSIYEQRPRLCRELEPRSQVCEREIEDKGETSRRVRLQVLQRG